LPPGSSRFRAKARRFGIKVARLHSGVGQLRNGHRVLAWRTRGLLAERGILAPSRESATIWDQGGPLAFQSWPTPERAPATRLAHSGTPRRARDCRAFARKRDGPESSRSPRVPELANSGTGTGRSLGALADSLPRVGLPRSRAKERWSRVKAISSGSGVGQLRNSHRPFGWRIRGFLAGCGIVTLSRESATVPRQGDLLGFRSWPAPKWRPAARLEHSGICRCVWDCRAFARKRDDPGSRQHGRVW